jgi:hypothetical protein
MNSPLSESNKKNNYFKEINSYINNIDSFEKYSLSKCLNNEKVKNQLFSKEPPPIDLIQKILKKLINKDLNDNIYYEFSRKNLTAKNIIKLINEFIPELKQYYLKCKHEKYLENLNEKKVITLFRQILKPYNFSITSQEKYENGEKYLLYTMEKKKKITFKKIESTINFD